MNTRPLLLALCLLFLPIASIPLRSAAVPQDRLPAAIRGQLDGAYPGWRPATVSEEVRAFFKDVRPDAEPWFIAGDFTGSGREDFAVQIVVPLAGHERRIVAAFLADGGEGYRRVELENGQPDPRVYLWLLKRGHEDVVAQTGKAITFPRDSVGVESSGPSVAYLFEHGSFKRIWLGI